MLPLNHVTSASTSAALLVKAAKLTPAATPIKASATALHTKWLHMLTPPKQVLRWGQQVGDTAGATFGFRYKCWLNQCYQETPWQFDTLLAWVARGGELSALAANQKGLTWMPIAQTFLRHKMQQHAQQRLRGHQQAYLPFASKPTLGKPHPPKQTLIGAPSAGPNAGPHAGPKRREPPPLPADACLNLLVGYPAS